MSTTTSATYNLPKIRAGLNMPKCSTRSFYNLLFSVASRHCQIALINYFINAILSLLQTTV